MILISPNIMKNRKNAAKEYTVEIQKIKEPIKKRKK
jgi:hypothetical protein